MRRLSAGTRAETCDPTPTKHATSRQRKSTTPLAREQRPPSRGPPAAMATTSTTPATNPPSSGRHDRNRSTSRTRMPSRPTTPLRPPSRTSLRASQTTPSGGASVSAADDPLAFLEPAFAELSDSMADLEANFMHLQLLNESLGRFNECFGSFLYGLNMSAFCVDFPEVSIRSRLGNSSLPHLCSTCVIAHPTAGPDPAVLRPTPRRAIAAAKFPFPRSRPAGCGCNVLNDRHEFRGEPADEWEAREQVLIDTWWGPREGRCKCG